MNGFLEIFKAQKFSMVFFGGEGGMVFFGGGGGLIFGPGIFYFILLEALGIFSGFLFLPPFDHLSQEIWITRSPTPQALHPAPCSFKFQFKLL